MAEDLNHIGAHPNPPTTARYRRVTFGSGAPTGTGWEGQPYFDSDTGDYYSYVSGTWTLISSGGGGGGSGDPEVFKLAGSSSPGAAPVGGAGVAYNEDGSFWIYTASGWTQIIA